METILKEYLKEIKRMEEEFILIKMDMKLKVIGLIIIIN